MAASVLANVLAAEPSLPARCVSAWPAIAFVLVVEVITRGTSDRSTATGRLAVDGAKSGATDDVTTGEQTGRGQSPSASSRPSAKKPHRPAGKERPRVRRPIEQTRELAANNPKISQAELARRLGISAT